MLKLFLLNLMEYFGHVRIPLAGRSFEPHPKAEKKLIKIKDIQSSNANQNPVTNPIGSRHPTW